MIRSLAQKTRAWGMPGAQCTRRWSNGPRGPSKQAALATALLVWLSPVRNQLRATMLKDNPTGAQGAHDEIDVARHPRGISRLGGPCGGQAEPSLPEESDRGQLCRGADGPAGATEERERRWQEIRQNAGRRSFGRQPEGYGRGKGDERDRPGWTQCQAEGRLRQDVEGVRHEVRPRFCNPHGRRSSEGHCGIQEGSEAVGRRWRVRQGPARRFAEASRYCEVAAVGQDVQSLGHGFRDTPVEGPAALSRRR